MAIKSRRISLISYPPPPYDFKDVSVGQQHFFFIVQNVSILCVLLGTLIAILHTSHLPTMINTPCIGFFFRKTLFFTHLGPSISFPDYSHTLLKRYFESACCILTTQRVHYKEQLLNFRFEKNKQSCTSHAKCIILQCSARMPEAPNPYPRMVRFNVVMIHGTITWP